MLDFDNYPIILGAPGSGKTTQALLLADKLNLEHISLGKIIRAKKLKNMYPYFFEYGVSVPNGNKPKDGLIDRIIIDRIKELAIKSDKEGIILTGYPRKKLEAENLIKILKKTGLKIKALINLNASFETIISRSIDMLICPKCGSIYNQLLLPKNKGRCDFDNRRLTKEKPDFVSYEKEFKQFIEENSDTYRYLANFSENYFSVSGNDSEIDTFSNIIVKLRNSVRENFVFYKRQSTAQLQTSFGEFQIMTYLSKVDYTYHLALVKGNVQGKGNVLVRIHSSCITGDIFGSLKCDCGLQLHESMRRIQKEGEGIIIYLFQEGRGINIINKISAYALQQGGLDTVEANEHIGLPPEMRQYDSVRDILGDLEVKSIRLLTNNPDKISKLTDLGIIIEKVIPLEIEPNDYNKKYLLAKKEKMKHKLSNV